MVYIVMQRGTEYNDEGYDINEGGDPIAAYSDKKVAQAAADKNLATWGRSNAPGHYCTYLNFNSGLFEGDEDDYQYERMFKKSVTDAEIVIFLRRYDLDMFYVAAVLGKV